MRYGDLKGKKFGRLEVLKKDTSSKRNKWICKCDCGTIKSIQACHFVRGKILSCGCLQKELASKVNKTHGSTHTSLYNRWKAMRQRCLNHKNIRYSDYGERGITICDEWNDFEKFRKWSLENGFKQNLSLDRIDNDKGYTSENCRWTTTSIQNRNRRDTIYISDGDKKIKLHYVSEITKIPFGTLYYRIFKQNKSTLQEIVTTDEYKLITNQSNKKLFEGVETR